MDVRIRLCNVAKLASTWRTTHSVGKNVLSHTKPLRLREYAISGSTQLIITDKYNNMYAIRQKVKSGAYEGTWYLTNDMTWSNDIARAYKIKSKEYADAMLNGIQAQYANKEMFVNEVVTIKK